MIDLHWLESNLRAGSPHEKNEEKEGEPARIAYM